MKIILTLLSVFSSVLVLSSCATKNDQLVIKKIKGSDRIYAGRIFVDFNGRKNADLKCELYVGKSLVPDVKLSDEGYMYFKSDSKSFRLSRIACYDQPDFYTAAWHFHNLPLDKFFKSDTPEKAVYFGDIYITWKFNPEDTKTAAAEDRNSPQFPKVGRVENSGVLQIEVRDDFVNNQKAFAERVENKTWNASESPTVLESHPVKIVEE